MPWCRSLLLSACLLRAALAAEPAPPAPATTEVASLAAMNIRQTHLDRVVEGLNYPRAMAFVDERTLLITEIGGRLLRLDLPSRSLTPIAGVPKVATAHDQTGLLDVALHPAFADNGWIYLSYVEADKESGRYFRLVVERARLRDDALHERQRLLAPEQFLWSPSNFGGALVFDGEGYLYASVGDRSESVFAQDGSRLEGKIVRLHDDGRVPADNPFVDDPRIDDRIYALGVRNPQGLHYDAPTGRLFEAEHGPKGGDEINLLKPGRNYGWPSITYGVEYTGEPLGQGTHGTGFEQPLFYYLPSDAISPLRVYRGRMFPEWDGDLIVGALWWKRLSRIDLDDLTVRSETRFLGEVDGRVRDIEIGADGSLYVLSQAGILFRLWREPPRPSPDWSAFDAGALYRFVCAGCHDGGAYGAPRPGVAAEWQPIQQQERALTYRRTIEGVGAMPPRGLCNFCKDDQLRRTVDYMLDELGKPAP